MYLDKFIEWNGLRRNELVEWEIQKYKSTPHPIPYIPNYAEKNTKQVENSKLKLPSKQKLLLNQF